MKVALSFVVFAALIAGRADAQNMPLSTVLAKADALKAKGPLALMSSDLGLLKREMQATAAALKAEREAAVKAGRKPAFCPPSKPVPISSNDMLAHFRTFPPAQRARMTSTDGMRTLLAKRYPCKA